MNTNANKFFRPRCPQVCSGAKVTSLPQLFFDCFKLLSKPFVQLFHQFFSTYVFDEFVFAIRDSKI